jgi:hypothetical protein
MPFTTPAADWVLPTGIDALVVHVLVAGSKASTVAKGLRPEVPPTA